MARLIRKRNSVTVAVEVDLDDLDLDDFIEDHGLLITGTGILPALSAAIERGDMAEARTQLDLLARELGPAARHEIEVARFSPAARRPAMAGGLVAA